MKRLYRLTLLVIMFFPLCHKTFADGNQLLEQWFSPGHTLDESRSETSFAPFITLAHDFNDDTSLYVSAKRGSKSGGFDPRSNSVSSFEFQGEKANTFEVGLRSISESEKFVSRIPTAENR